MGKNMKGSVCGSIFGTLPEFGRTKENHEKLRIVGLRAEI
jgi:hypothetical protein